MTELQPQTLEGAFKIHRRLLDYWAEGSRDLELLQGLRDAYLLHPHVDEFVNVISTACFKTAALTAANFFYKEPNSIRLTYMFDFLRGMKSILTPSDFEVLRNKVGEFEVYL